MRAAPSPALLSLQIFAGLRHHWRELLIYHLYFALLTLAVLAPVSSWITTRVLATSGRPVISNQEVMAFLASPAGIGWLLCAGTVTALLVFVEHGGMMVIGTRRTGRPFGESLAALGSVVRQLPGLLVLAALVIAAHLALAAPWLLLGIAAYDHWLAPLSLSQAARIRPEEFRLFTGVAALAGVLLIAGNGWLYLRWVLALPILLMERVPPTAALGRSSRLTRGRRRQMAVPLLAGLVLLALGPAVLSLLFDTAGSLIGRLPERMGLQIAAVALFLLIYVLTALVVTLLGLAANSFLLLTLYRHAAGHPTGFAARSAPRRSGVRAWGVELVIVLFALGQTAWTLNGFDLADDVSVTAHRGSSLKAPENTLPAIRQAVADGADYVEVDARQTADGHVVLHHDASLYRTTGDPRRVWEVPFDELRQLDAGSRFDPTFAGERIPTLEEAIEAVRGQARLYVEIKTSPHTPDLTRKVVATLRAADFVNQARLGAMAPGPLHQALAMEPGLKTTLFVQFSIGPLERRFDALGLRHTLVSADRVRDAHRHGQEIHVWTVNDPRRMSRLIDLGVDHIITDRPDVLATLLADRAERTTAELLLLKARNWLWE